MRSDDSGSVTHWLDGLRDGDSAAAQELWNRYFAQLAPIAQARLQRLAQVQSGEDIALSAMNSVMVGLHAGRYPNLSDREGLWSLLVTITARKAISEQRRQLAGRRSKTRECSLEDVRDYIGVMPSAEFAAEVADELERLTIALDEPTLRRLVELKLGGFTHDEIAAELGCTSRTVIRKLNRIRQEWCVASGQGLDTLESLP